MPKERSTANAVTGFPERISIAAISPTPRRRWSTIGAQRLKAIAPVEIRSGLLPLGMSGDRGGVQVDRQRFVLVDVMIECLGSGYEPAIATGGGARLINRRERWRKVLGEYPDRAGDRPIGGDVAEFPPDRPAAARCRRGIHQPWPGCRRGRAGSRRTHTWPGADAIDRRRSTGPRRGRPAQRCFHRSTAPGVRCGQAETRGPRFAHRTGDASSRANRASAIRIRPGRVASLYSRHSVSRFRAIHRATSRPDRRESAHCNPGGPDVDDGVQQSPARSYRRRTFYDLPDDGREFSILAGTSGVRLSTICRTSAGRILPDRVFGSPGTMSTPARNIYAPSFEPVTAPSLIFFAVALTIRERRDDDLRTIR